MLIKPERLDSFETDVLDTADLAGERRMYRHLLAYWRTRRRGRSFPVLTDIRPDGIGDLWPSCFILDPVSNPHFPCFHYLGPALAKYVGILLGGSSDWALSLLDITMVHCREALDTQVPILIEDAVPRFDGRQFLFRAILLPVGDSGRKLHYLLGTASGKVADD
jgi:hypothetical protein